MLAAARPSEEAAPGRSNRESISPGDIVSWLETFAHSFLNGLAAPARAVSERGPSGTGTTATREHRNLGCGLCAASICRHQGDAAAIALDQKGANQVKILTDGVVQTEMAQLQNCRPLFH